MKYLLDTDISSYYLRGRFNLLDTFERKGIQNLRLSRITVAELEVLAFKNPHSKINFSSIQTLSQNCGVLEVDTETWQIFSKLKADTLSGGTKRGDFDILIASTAIRYNMILVTNNTSHYEDIANVENWVEDKK